MISGCCVNPEEDVVKTLFIPTSSGEAWEAELLAILTTTIFCPDAGPLVPVTVLFWLTILIMVGVDGTGVGVLGTLLNIVGFDTVGVVGLCCWVMNTTFCWGVVGVSDTMFEPGKRIGVPPVRNVVVWDAASKLDVFWNT